MRALIAVLGVLVTIGVLVVCTVVELLIKLAPLLVLAAWIWIAIKVWRWRRERRENRGHIESPWEWEHPAHGPVGAQAACTPVPAAAGSAAPLPPVIAHQDRSFVVRGHDSGLLADREDGSLYVSATDLPRVPRVPAARQHRGNVGARRTSGRRQVRRRP